jgi:ribonuclease HI
MTKIDTPTATAHTDGACLGNPGPGGWAAILHIGGKERVLTGRAAGTTTNQRMELMAAIMALEALPAGLPVTVVSDSEYVVKGASAWLAGWKARGWRNTQGKPTANRDLWERLDALNAARPVTWRWTKGHAGHALNERVDGLANAEAEAAAREAGWNPSARRFGQLPTVLPRDRRGMAR